MPQGSSAVRPTNSLYLTFTFPSNSSLLYHTKYVVEVNFRLMPILELNYLASFYRRRGTLRGSTQVLNYVSFTNYSQSKFYFF